MDVGAGGHVTLSLEELLQAVWGWDPEGAEVALARSRHIPKWVWRRVELVETLAPRCGVRPPETYVQFFGWWTSRWTCRPEDLRALAEEAHHPVAMGVIDGSFFRPGGGGP